MVADKNNMKGATEMKTTAKTVRIARWNDGRDRLEGSTSFELLLLKTGSIVLVEESPMAMNGYEIIGRYTNVLQAVESFGRKTRSYTKN
jgi:hypothetical protein